MPDLLLYIFIASLTIISPGPGILLTLSNTISYRLSHAIWGIVGIVTGMGVIGAIASSSLGVMLMASPRVLIIIKVIGAVYLLYLGIKLFRSKPKGLEKKSVSIAVPHWRDLFMEGFIITLFNPKPIIFFMALFPQFINTRFPMVLQFIILTIIFCILVFFIHILYGCFAMLIKRKLAGDKFFTVFNQVAGGIFVLFSALLGTSIFI